MKKPLTKEKETKNSIAICPKCYPRNRVPLQASKEKPGFVFCSIHGQMRVESLYPTPINPGKEADEETTSEPNTESIDRSPY